MLSYCSDAGNALAHCMWEKTLNQGDGWIVIERGATPTTVSKLRISTQITQRRKRSSELFVSTSDTHPLLRSTSSFPDIFRTLVRYSFVFRSQRSGEVALTSNTRLLRRGRSVSSSSQPAPKLKHSSFLEA